MACDIPVRRDHPSAQRKSPAAVVVFEMGKEERSVNQLEEYFAYSPRREWCRLVGQGCEGDLFTLTVATNPQQLGLKLWLNLQRR
eukprot:gene277-9927_t